MSAAPVAISWLMASLTAAPADAQRPLRTFAPLEGVRVSGATAGSPSERTLSLLSLATGTALAGTLRPFDLPAIDSIARAAGMPELAVSSGFVLAPVWATLYWNTGAPRVDQDGSVWQGRGATVAGGAGMRFRWRPVDISVQPLVWVAQNASYKPAFTPPIADEDYRYPFSNLIDMPYRFGDAVVQRIDPGESWVRIGGFGTALGFATANQQWGPGYYYPLVMGTEGGGYPRVFVEARSLNLGAARLTANWSMGRLESSRYHSLEAGSRSRLVPALLVSLQPRGFSTLEIGATRLFHTRWSAREATWNKALLPLKGLLKSNNPTNEFSGPDHNQLASVYVRVAPGGAKGEVYGEFYREDHNWDARDLIGEPDHASAFMLGVQRVITGTGPRKTLVVLEMSNGRITHLQRIRKQAPVYTHSPVLEGHTVRGQPMGSAALIGGGGMTFGMHRVEARRSSSFEAEVRRAGQNLEGGSWNGTFTGTYAVRYSRTQLKRRTQSTISLTLERNYGLDRLLNAGVGLSIAR